MYVVFTKQNIAFTLAVVQKELKTLIIFALI